MRKWRPFLLSNFLIKLNWKTKKRFYLFESLFSSLLCPVLLIQSPSDWIFTADWVNLAFHPQTILLTQLFHSSSFLFFAEGVNHPYPRSFSHWLLWVPLVLSSGFLLTAQICRLVSKLSQLWLSPSLVCFPLAVCLSGLLFLFSVFLSAPSGQKCLRHTTRVLDTQVLISPSQEQVHSEVRE